MLFVTSIVDPCLKAVFHENHEGKADALQDPFFVARMVHLFHLHEFRFVKNLHSVVRGRRFVLNENDTAESTGANSSETLKII